MASCASVRSIVTLSAVALAGAAGCGSTPDERRVSVYELRADPNDGNVQRIRELLSDEDPDVRATALNTLVGLEVGDSEQLAVSAAGDPDGFVRSIAAKRLGDLSAVEQVPLLRTLVLEDSDAWVRKTAAESLEIVGGDAAVDALLMATADPMPEVRLVAVRALRRLAPSRSVAELSRLLLEDPSWEVRVQSAAGLGVSGSQEAVPALRRALEDEAEQVSSAAANSLTLLGHPEEGAGGGGTNP